MKLLDHYATCPGWTSGSIEDCTCYAPPPWRIRKDPASQFPWRIWRRTNDLTYAPMMCASTWQAAFELVQQLQWLRHNSARREPHE